MDYVENDGFVRFFLGVEIRQEDLVQVLEVGVLAYLLLEDLDLVHCFFPLVLVYVHY